MTVGFLWLLGGMESCDIIIIIMALPWDLQWDCFGIAVILLWDSCDCHEIAVRALWHCRGIDVGFLWD